MYTDAVVIREEYQEGHVEAEWSFDNYRLIESRTGRIVGEPDEEGEFGECAGHSDMWKIQMCTGVLYLRVSQTVRRGRALPEGDFRKDCATAAGGGSGQTFLPDEVEDIPYTGSKGAIRDRKRSLYWA